MTKNLSRYLIYISLALLLGLAILYFTYAPFTNGVDEAYVVFTSDDRQRISEYVRSYGWYGPLILLVGFLVQMFLFVIPSWLLMIVSALAYGPVWGTLLSIGCVTFAAGIAYAIGHALGAGPLQKLVGEKNEASMQKTVNEYGAGGVFVFRLAPFLSNDTISFVAGAVRLGFWKFVVATLTGITPLAILIAVFSDSTEELKSALIWVGGASLLLYVGWVAWKHFYKD